LSGSRLITLVQNSSSKKWMAAHLVPIHVLLGNGGKYHAVQLSDLPEPERRALLERQISDADLPQGTYDDDLHDRFMQMKPCSRKAGERRAQQMIFVTIRRNHGRTWRQTHAELLANTQAGNEKCPSIVTLKRWTGLITDVDPINWAPTLAPGHKGRVAKANISDAAWGHFMTTIRDAYREFPLKSAWRDTWDVGKLKGWDVPSYATFYRRWYDLSEAQRLTARFSKKTLTSG